MNTLARFGGSSARLLGPLAKLQESVALVLAGRLELVGHQRTVEQVLAVLDSVRQTLETIEFPEHYDAGPVLLDYAHTGLDNVTACVAQLSQLEGPGDHEWANARLAEAHQAFAAVRELIQEIQAEQGR